MASPFLTRNALVLCKVESTYGTDPVPVVATDAVLTQVPNIVPEGAILSRDTVRSTLSKEQPIIGRKLMRTSFSVEIKSTIRAAVGASASPMDIDGILRAMGFTPTYTPETSGGANDGQISYALRSTGFESFTFYIFFQDVRYVIRGAFATGTFRFEAGQLPVLDVEVTGLYTQPTDVTPTAPTYESDKPFMAESMGLSIQGVDPICRNFSFALNNTIVERADVNSAEGFFGLRIADRNPTANCLIEAQLVATQNLFSIWDAGTAGSVDLTQGPAVAGDRLIMTFPKAVITGITPSDDGGIHMYGLDFLLAANTDAGDDEMTLVFD